MGAWHRDPVPRASVRLITWGMIWPMLTFFLIGLPGLLNPGFQHAGTMAPLGALLGGRPMAVMIPIMLFTWAVLARYLDQDQGAGNGALGQAQARGGGGL
ncbi:MAG: hypothetical protein ACJAZN_000916 [Planctomycetota bacterium]